MKKHLTFAAAITLLMLASLGLAQSDQREPRRPNIVFILVDDLRWDELGTAGYPFIGKWHMDNDETAAVSGVSTGTVRNDWNSARVWLKQEITR